MPEGEVSKTKVCFVGGERDKEIQTCSSPLTLAVLVTNLFQPFDETVSSAGYIKNWQLLWMRLPFGVLCFTVRLSLSYNMSAIANQRAFPYIFLADLKKKNISYCYFSEICLFFTMFTGLSHFKGSVSNIWWIIYIITYTSICLQMKVTSLRIFFFCHFITVRMEIKPSSPTRVSLFSV